MKYILLSLLLLGCASSGYFKSLDQEKVQGLSEKEAADRFSLVSDVKYNLKFTLTLGEKYSGENTISFTGIRTDKPLRIDYHEGIVHEILLNGKNIDIKNYNSRFILIPKNTIKIGENTLKILFSRNYNNDGSGLHKFTDPEDKKQYLYTDFEPFDANKLFPCFDQPDLKAKYVLEVEAPKNWIVISYAKEKSVKDVGENKVWTFPESLKFSTYIFSLHAGEYKVWEDNFEGMPLRLLARQSLAKYVIPSEWFEISKQGFKFYNNYFGVNYPYGKYDQIIVPDFNAGAMENVAAVTFTENYVFRGKATIIEQQRRSDTILHEMAHMWFGDLVTMKWWNGLWLNESFATFMANYSLKKATVYQDVWQTFFASTKSWAYWEDNLVTTHPIELPVNDTSSAFSNFDGITYGKGASVLKQLNFLLGEEKFQKGIQKYFAKYAEQNTRIENFIGSLEEGSGKKLDSWVEQWLKTTGSNKIKVDYACDKNKISSFALIQDQTPREHKTQIALLKNNKVYYVSQTVYDKSTNNVSELIGKECPDFVYPNYQDYDFVSVDLDAKSVEFAQKKLSSIADNFLRLMVFNTLWEMVEGNSLSVEQYVDTILPALKVEKDLIIISSTLRKLNRSASYFYKLSNNEYLNTLDSFLWSQTLSAKAHSDEKKLYFKSFTENAIAEKSLKELNSLINKEKNIAGLEIDQDMRWPIIKKLNSVAFNGADKILQNEKELDKSERGQRSAIEAEVARPETKTKDQYFAQLKDKSISLAKHKSIMASFFPVNQFDMIASYKKQYFDLLSESKNTRDEEFLDALTDRFVPSDCTQNTINDLKTYFI